MKIIFTLHAEERLEKRKVLREEIIDAVNYPTDIEKKHDKYYCRKRLNRGMIEIVYEKTESNIKVITLYWI